MIDFVRGKPVHIEADYAVIDVGGVGYRVFCPNPYAIGAKNGEEVTVFTHQHVREDAMLLFGFPTRDEQRFFRLLLEVSGVGPKVALGVLAGAKPDAVTAAIRREDVAFLTKLPGIGRKTAQRMILDLKDKLSGGSLAEAFAGFGLEAAGYEADAGQSVWAEAKMALQALGYTEAEADRALASVKAKGSEGDSLDALIKKALQALLTVK